MVFVAEFAPSFCNFVFASEYVAPLFSLKSSNFVLLSNFVVFAFFSCFFFLVFPQFFLFSFFLFLLFYVFVFFGTFSVLTSLRFFRAAVFVSAFFHFLSSDSLFLFCFVFFAAIP